MTTAVIDADEVRAWARAEGHDVADRGRIPAIIQQAYDAAHPPAGAPEIPSQSSASWDDGGVTAGDFPEDVPEDVPGEPQETAEKQPRIVRPPRNRGRGTAKGSSARRRFSFLPAMPKVKGPRTNLSEFASDTWRDLAQLTAPIPPLSKVLAIQAPFAGVVFDEAIAGIPLADALLQPVARYSTSIRALNGLFGPPVFTLDLCLNGKFEQDEKTGRPTGPANQRTAMSLSGLRYSLVQMIRVGNLNAEKIAIRAEEDAEMDKQVDRLISLILGITPQAPPPPPAPAPAEGEAIVHPARVFRYPPSPQMDGTGADPGRM